MTFLHCRLVATALYLAFSIKTARSSNLYAFYTQRSIQAAAQDPDTGRILYSNCNSLDEPVFPVENPNVLPTFSSPQNGTALAAAGWWDGTQVLASVFFQNEDGEIANCFYECDMETGRFNRTAESYPSLIARVGSVHERTGLSVELLVDQVGYRQYRLFYHNADRQIMMMSWEQDAKLWTDTGRVSQDTDHGMALASVYHEGKDISVVAPRGSGDIEVARLPQDDLWQLGSFPRPLKGNATNETAPSQMKFDDTASADFSLPFWNPNTKAIGLAVTKNGLREVYYIGTDTTLYQARESSTYGEWILGPNGSQSTWSKADERSGGIAVVSRSKVPGEVWIYYWVDGAIIQVYKSAAGIWEEAKTLPPNTTSTDVARPPVGGNGGENSGPGGWSTAMKAGVGLGVTAGVLTVGVLIWVLFNRHNALSPIFRTRGAHIEGESHSDLPELCIVQRATPISVQSARPSTARRAAELEQPGMAYELSGHTER
ncbi:uncharacterized protein NECHADRAFT_52084 [Fusarium vanettenii 77-13-4]|uniref:Fucose-specific lectin n=1 Tax=Fusarium vanettenii (strain ATCC MYA-4622 / CBS 123669 / FGSC 9596 / NRRL 45880 / 77-13-4) TaxID=660122 RepID=C7ZG13_FUSV7|nr:uncharacterized protein NECHADRAFT_52084 [Fusarium vanettenii 77-13-4]EEU36979.1 hypothetical protein NECHADRAFT_52084 [Fusarium vanettenii 77-13-4]